MLTSRLAVAMLAAFVPPLACAVPAADRGRTVIPVVSEAPTCGHDKLGQVSIQIGTRVTESNRDPVVPTVGYAAAFARLATVAREKGADAVVIRRHQATYFTRNGRRSSRPVHIQLNGAAIHLRDGAGACSLALADPGGFDEGARHGTPADVDSRDAFHD